MAEKHRKPWLHIDAGATPLENAVKLIRDWISDNRIQVLNVAGARKSEDAKIYPATRAILETLLREAGAVDSEMPESGA